MIEDELLRYGRFLSKEKGFASYSVKKIYYDLRLFIGFASARGISLPRDLGREIIEDWAEELSWRVGREGQIKLVTRAHHLSSLRGFLHFLYERHLTFTDLSSFVILPRVPRSLPGMIYEHEEAQRMIEVSDGGPVGMRDRAMLEVLYSSGLRASELGGLKLGDVDCDSGLIYVRGGKGSKDRVVPMGRMASTAVKDYLLRARREFVRGSDPGMLFLNKNGRRISRYSILDVVKSIARSADIKKNATTHAFRRTCATLLLRDGANVRMIQEMLGHDRLETTAVYLKVSAREIKAEHEKHHPRDKVEGPEAGTSVDKG